MIKKEQIKHIEKICIQIQLATENNEYYFICTDYQEGLEIDMSSLLLNLINFGVDKIPGFSCDVDSHGRVANSFKYAKLDNNCKEYNDAKINHLQSYLEHLKG